VKVHFKEYELPKKVEMDILRTLIKWDMPLPISRIAKEIGSNYITVRKHLKSLVGVGLVFSVVYGKRTLYKAEMANERIVILKQFLEAWKKCGVRRL